MNFQEYFRRDFGFKKDFKFSLMRFGVYCLFATSSRLISIDNGSAICLGLLLIFFGFILIDYYAYKYYKEISKDND